jgi:hypothetical protein
LNRTMIVATITAGIAVLVGIPASATSVVPNKGTRGIAAVCLYVDVLDETPVPDPWPELEQECRQQLEKGGVQTVEINSCFQSKNNAALFLSVSGVPSASGKLWAYAVHLELSQDVTLRRDLSQTLDSGAVTSSSLKVGLAATDRLAASVRAAALDLVKGFSGLYRAENRKP